MSGSSSRPVPLPDHLSSHERVRSLTWMVCRRVPPDERARTMTGPKPRVLGVLCNRCKDPAQDWAGPGSKRVVSCIRCTAARRSVGQSRVGASV